MPDFISSFAKGAAAPEGLHVGKPVTLRVANDALHGLAPKNLRELIEAGGVEALVRAAGERAMRDEAEFWLPVLERYKLPEDAAHIAGLRQRLGIKLDIDTIRAQTDEGSP